MWYVPYLRVRRAIVIYALAIGALSCLAIALRLWPTTLSAPGSHLELRYDGHVQGHFGYLDLPLLVAGAAAFVAGLATVLGLSLAAENEGHLEVAWTKPVSREGYALRVFAVDIVAMVVALVLTVLCGVVVCEAWLGLGSVGLGTASDFGHTLMVCGLPLGVYAWIAALTASLRRNRGAVAGLFWPALFAVEISAASPVAPLAALGHALAFVSPLAENNWGWVISAALLAVALVQWRRLEA